MNFFNIHKDEERIYLQQATYTIYIVGGFYVRTGFFRIILRNTTSGEEINCPKTKWKFQRYVGGKRAKALFKVEILNQGDYEIIYSNSGDVRVSKSNLPKLLLTKIVFPEKIIPNKEIQVYFVRTD